MSNQTTTTKTFPPLELTRVIPALAEANAMKGTEELMPNACFMQVDRCIDLKERRYVMLKEPSPPLPKGKFTPAQQFWTSASNPKESFNLFARISTVGCSDMENKAAAMALVGQLIDHQLVCNGIPVLEWGLCRTTITKGLLTLVYKWDLKQDMSQWDSDTQASAHNFLYFVIRRNEIDSQPTTMYFDLSALQYGVLDTPHKTTMPIPYVFSDRESCAETYPHIYGEQVTKWKTTKNILDEYLRFGEMLVRNELPLEGNDNVEQKRKIIQLMTNFAKFKRALQLVIMETSKSRV